MPPQDPQGPISPYSMVPQYNTMQMNAGILPTGVPAPHPGQVALMLQQQAMQTQYAALRPPMLMGGQQLAHPGMFGPSMPPPLFGLNMGARQHAVHTVDRGMSLLSGTVGVGARFLGGMAASALGGPIGGIAFEALGGGQAIQDLAQAPFAPFMAERQRTLALQSASTRFVVGGSSMSSAGAGLSAFGAQQVTSGLNRMSMDRGFQASTQGMFNRADLDRITRLSGELGMLDQSQNADQMIREVKKVSKALSNFMKLAEEPDIQRAMQQMAKLRSMGFTAMEMPTAAANARTFARMAGVSVQEAMAGAERGAGMFQAAGLTGAAGYNAGLAAQGFARQASTFMSPQQLALAGGREGLEGTLLQASRGAFTNPALTASLLNFRGGVASVDQAAIQRMISGGFNNIGSQVQQGAANMRGAGLGGINNMMARMPELQDTIARQLGPNGMMLLAGVQAQQIVRQTRGAVSFGNALSMMNPGMDPSQAYHIEQMMANPDFQRSIMQQMQVSQREGAVARRNMVMEQTSFRNRARRFLEDRVQLSSVAGLASGIPGGGMLGMGLQGLRAMGGDTSVHGLGTMFETGIMAPVSNYLADEQDQEEALLQQGEGGARIVRRSRYGSRLMTRNTRAIMRDRFRGGTGAFSATLRGGRALSAGEDAGAEQLDRDSSAALRSGSVTGYLLAKGVSHFYGAEGFHLSEGARGGETMRQAYVEGLTMPERLAHEISGGPSASVVRQRMAERERFANIVDSTEQYGGTQAYRDMVRRLERPMGVGQGATPGQAGAQIDAARATAAAAVRSYVQNRGSGGTIGAGSGDQLQSQVVTALQRQGMSAVQVSHLMTDPAFMAQAMTTAQQGMNTEQRQTLSAITERGRTAGSLRQTRSVSNVIERGNRAGAEGAQLLGLGNNERGASSMLGLLSNSGDARLDAAKQRYVAARLMQRSDAASVKRKGDQDIAALQRELSPDDFAAIEGAVNATFQDMGDEAVSRMGRDVSRAGGGSRQRIQQIVAQVAGKAEEKQLGAGAAALTSVLGESAAQAFDTGGVRALRMNADSIKDRRIRQMVKSGADDNAIQTAIQDASNNALDTESGTSSGGAGTTPGEEASGGIMQTLLSTLTHGFSDFPSATQKLDTAATRLLDVADRLADANGIARAAGNTAAGGGDSPGFSVTLGGHTFSL